MMKLASGASTRESTRSPAADGFSREPIGAQKGNIGVSKEANKETPPTSRDPRGAPEESFLNILFSKILCS